MEDLLLEILSKRLKPVNIANLSSNPTKLGAAQKLELCYMLGMMNEFFVEAVKLFFTLRNRVAHYPGTFSFDEPAGPPQAALNAIYQLNEKKGGMAADFPWQMIFVGFEVGEVTPTAMKHFKDHVKQDKGQRPIFVHIILMYVECLTRVALETQQVDGNYLYEYDERDRKQSSA